MASFLSRAWIQLKLISLDDCVFELCRFFIFDIERLKASNIDTILNLQFAKKISYLLFTRKLNANINCFVHHGTQINVTATNILVWKIRNKTKLLS